MNISFRIRCIKNSIKFWLINCRYRLKYKPIRAEKRNIIYLVFVPDRKHAGLSDRLKVMVSVFHDAKLNGYRFKCYWGTPFPLSRYLRPKYDWVASLEELEYSLFDTKIVNESDGKTPCHLSPGKQYHIYNYYAYVFDEYFADIQCYWMDLFDELFSPNEILEQELLRYNVAPSSYISVHLRFVNALEHFEDTFFENKIDDESQRQALIAKCKRGITEIVNQHPNTQVYVFSDSKVFLDSLNDIQVKILGSECLGHCGENTNDDVHMKTFVDLFFMSRSKEIYWITCPEIYQYSGFAKMAARIGGIPFTQKRL